MIFNHILDELFPPINALPENDIYPKPFSKKKDKAYLSNFEKENIKSFIRTQLEEVRRLAHSPALVDNNFLERLSHNNDIDHLRDMLLENCDLNQFVVQYFKKVKINAHTTITSVGSTGNGKRDNSCVLVREEIDLTPQSATTNMVVKSFYYRINYFFEFKVGQTIIVLANANELKLKEEILDFKGISFNSIL